jgi:hypothetical protein
LIKHDGLIKYGCLIKYDDASEFATSQDARAAAVRRPDIAANPRLSHIRARQNIGVEIRGRSACRGVHAGPEGNHETGAWYVRSVP